ncbi:MAG TPA: phosphatase PAP2 family protein [Cyclobacteriaceae bacterium]|nr:phosphatase PAP2 family protein [Cyclobacteriaceae bacterium]
MDTLIEWDRELLIYLNSFHTPWLDPIVLFMTKTLAWLPLYLFLLYLIYRNYKKDSWIVLIGIAITILLADQITSGVMKPLFMRLRPSNEPSLVGIIHLVDNYKGGRYGFASSHAANTFGTAMFFWLLFRKQYGSMYWLFLWAAVLTYTRIYLGVHYPGDILVGGIIGLMAGWIGYFAFTRIKAHVNPTQPTL